MKVAVQPEDLQLLARSLHELVVAEVPYSELFQIKCAVQKDELMILTQHPVGLRVDSEHLFAVLSEALQSLPTSREQRVQCFIRKVGEELPYARYSLNIKQNQQMKPAIPLSSSLTYTPSMTEDEPDDPEELFEPLEYTQESWATQPQRPIKYLLLGITLLGICVFGTGFYLLSRPCVMSECKELQAAQELNLESQELMRRANSEKRLVAIQQHLETTSSNLGVIPRWSSRYQQAEDLKASLSMQSDKINLVLTAFQTADLAEQKMQTTANSLEEIQEIQHLWRQAITPLEAISPGSELYMLVQPQLSNFRVSLQAVNEQLTAQEQWLKKLNDAKAVVIVAEERAATAKSLDEWQKAQSTWQIAINAFNIIPDTSPAYEEAQALLLEYKPQLANTRDRATREQIAAQTYQQAISTANQAKTLEQKNQWQVAVTYWEQALENVQQIPQDSVYYGQSQLLIKPYSIFLQQAQGKVKVNRRLQQVRNELEETCSREIRICTFTINNTGIAVSLTPEYEYIIQTTLSEADLQTTNHWYVLQEVLGVIGDYVNLPVFIYDTQGQGKYTHIPQG